MHKQYLNQTLRLLKENKLISIISIIGTALTICLIMMLVIAHEVRVMNYAPESNRDRTLYVKWAGVEDKKTDENKGNSFLSLKTVKACFLSLKTPEIVSVVSPLQSQLAIIPGGTKRQKCHVLFTDNAFWKIFNFTILSGRPYSKEEFEAGIKKVVVAESLARELFGSTNVVGKTMELGYMPYIICGVVKDVPSLLESVYARAWVPYSSVNIASTKKTEDVLGKYKIYILAKSSKDFSTIRREVDQRVNMYNSSLSDYKITLYRQPDTKYVEGIHGGPFYPDVSGSLIYNISLVLILLIVPAINLSGITLSRMKKRMAEIGVRKAFGATRKELIQQILYENLVLTFIGGVLGLFFSYISIVLFKDWILNTTAYKGMHIAPDLSIEVFVNPMTFVFALFFCVVLNLLSAGIPAYRTSSMNVVDALNVTK